MPAQLGLVKRPDKQSRTAGTCSIVSLSLSGLLKVRVVHWLSNGRWAHSCNRRPQHLQHTECKAACMLPLCRVLHALHLVVVWGCAYKRSDLPRSCCDLLGSHCRTALLQSLEESHMYSCARQV